MNPTKGKVLIICFTDTTYDARVARQIDFLRDAFNVTFVGYGLEDLKGIEFIKISETKLDLKKKGSLAFLLLTKQFERAYWSQYPYKYLKNKLKPFHYDLILANDIESLPLAFYLNEQNKSKILFDAHEYAPRHFEDRLYWRIFFRTYIIYWCKKLIPKVHKMTTVSDGLATEYKREFGVQPEIINNAPPFKELSPKIVDPDHIKLIHHGIVNISRKLENIIEMMDYLDDRFSLDIMVRTTSTSSKKSLKYFEGLKNLAATSSKRINFLPPVLSKEVVNFLNNYDFGIFLLEPINFNYKYALPNKIFDFVQARLGIGIGPSIEMEKIVKKYDLGVVADNFSPGSLAEKLNKLSHQDIFQFKINSNSAARALSAEKNKILLIDLINNLIDSQKKN